MLTAFKRIGGYVSVFRDAHGHRQIGMNTHAVPLEISFSCTEVHIPWAYLER